MSGESTAPAASDKLIQLIRNTTGVLTTDGMGITDAEATEVIQIGYVDTDDDAFAEGTAVVEGLGGRSDRENYDLHCALIVINSEGESGDPQLARDRAFALLGQIRAMLIVTQPSTIAQGVMNVSVTSWSYRPDKVEAGARAMIRFDLNIDSYTAP